MRLHQITGAATTRRVYDGLALIGEYNAAGTMLRRYVHGPGVDEPVVWYEGAGATDKRWLHADERGSVIAVSDASGAAIAVNTYDEYGVPASGNLGVFGYTGQVWVPELGMWHYKARMYAPSLGRFMQADPIDYDGGINLYAYVGGDPVNFTDPLGLRCQPNTCLRRADPPIIGDRCRVIDCTPSDRLGVISTRGPAAGSSDRGQGSGGRQAAGRRQQKTNNCTASVNGTPSPRDAARSTRSAVASRSLTGALAGLAAGPGGALIGAVVGYGSVAVQRAYQLYPGNSWDARNGAAGNRIYGAVTSALGVPRDLALRMSGAIEQHGRDSNAPYDPSNGSFTDRSGNLGNSDGAIRDIDEGATCAR